MHQGIGQITVRDSLFFNNTAGSNNVEAGETLFFFFFCVQAFLTGPLLHTSPPLVFERARRALDSSLPNRVLKLLFGFRGGGSQPSAN